jgi:hypothetical protein
MNRRFHISIPALLAGYSVYRELWEDIPGTGQSVMELLRSGYTRWEVARYFPWTIVNFGVLAVAMAIAAHGLLRKHNESL